ncbi:LysE family translocator [Marinomonas balearica]|uniref:Threonine/homoserine/homoserine lactone efflux protein n=1 Tax=Marinomonas balearica TaxID=491947 RepID=A0A4R6MD48_9GAMM|nr:LysE family translocator [Marinomonas balearica]TDO99473.1 threonine/homoserine/homoserine lactone efflux protein [Marinomonas balearica]
MNLNLLSVFIPTFFFVSVTPGMCMTLAMTLGMTVGIRRALWMMVGELVGVGLVAVLTAVGVATILLRYPDAFLVLKYAGGAYLAYMGIQMWLSKGKMAIKMEEEKKPASKIELAAQGFVTAVSNPKGWAFFVALLPPFLSTETSLVYQLFILVSVILLLEFVCLLIYALGGRSMKSILMKSGNVKMMNRLAGTLMLFVGIWLAFG